MVDAETIVEFNPVEMTDEQLEAELNPKAEEPTVEEPVEEPKEDEQTPIEEPPKEETPAEEPPKEEPFTITKEEWEKTQKRLEEKEKFIQRQADEVGKRRKSEEQLRQEVFNLKTQLAGDGVNHVEAMEIQNAIREREAQLTESELHTITEFNRNTVKSFVPETDNMLDDMAEILKEDGQVDEAIRAFRYNPYAESPGVVINLAKRAEMRKELRNKDAKIASLEAELASMKQEPKKVVEKIAKALKENPQMTNKSGQASSTKETISETQIPHLSDAELDRLIKESS